MKAPTDTGRLIALLLPVALLICSCTGNERSDFAGIPPEGWLYGDTLEFSLAGNDSVVLQGADLAVVVRHTNNYEYSNIWLELTYLGADSLHTDTLNLQLADEFGTWRGTGTGVSFQRIDTVRHGIDIASWAPVKVRHIMRVDTLREVEQVGIVINSEIK